MSRPLVAVVDGDYHMLRGEGTTAAVLINLLGRTCGGVDEGFVAVFVKAEPSRKLQNNWLQHQQGSRFDTDLICKKEGPHAAERSKRRPPKSSTKSLPIAHF